MISQSRINLSRIFSAPAWRHAMPWFGIVGAWFLVLIAGWVRLNRYTYHPDETRGSVTVWPEGVLPGLASSGFRIVMFVHPLCPCTRASLMELDETLARIPEDIPVTVVPVTAGLQAGSQSAGGVWDELRALPRVLTHVDATGEVVRRFGATVSGEVFAFDQTGRRVFHGGLTPGRGHQGDAEGQRRLEELARGESTISAEAPVFGCRLPGR